MDRKLESAIECLQSYCNESRVVRCKEEDFQTLRTMIHRITTALKSSEIRNRFLSHPAYSQNLIYALQMFPDRTIRVLIIRLFSRLFGKSGLKKNSQSLVQKGLTRALFQTLFLESNESSPNEEFLLRIHQLLYRLGPMDQRFGVRARVNQCLSITLCLLRTQVTVLGSCSAAPSTTLCSPLGSSNAPASSWTVCGAGTRGSVSSGLISPGSASATTGSGTGGLMGKCTSSALGPSGSSNLIATNPVSGTSSNMVSGLAHGTSTGTVVTIPSTLSRHLTIVLRTLRLYVSGSGRNNASALGRAGAISLLLRLLALVAGLPPPRTQTGRLSPTVSISKANSSSSTAVGQNSTGCSGSLNSFSTPYLGTAVASRSFSGNFAIGGGNNTGGSGIVGNMASCTSGQDIHSTTSLGRIAAENGLVIGSPIVTAVTATASAAASLQRHRLRISTASRNEKGFASLVGSSSHTSIGFLASTAASMLSAPPALIAGGVRYHSNLLRLVLNTLHCLIRWKHNATRAISSGGISILLDLFLDVHRCDLHGRRIPLQRSALACLKSLTASRAGRKMLIACGGIHTLFAICAGYVGPDPLTPYMGDSAPSRVNAVENEKPFIPHRKHGTQVNSTHGIHSTTSHQYDSITVSKLSASTVLHSSLSSENCEAKRIPPWSGSIQSASGITSSSLSTVPVPSNKSKISTLVPSGTSSSNDGSVAAGDSGFGSGVTDAARTAMDSAHVSRGTKSDELISVLTEATMLLRRCCPRSRLPVSSAEGVLRFPLRHASIISRGPGSNGEGIKQRDAPITSDAERSPISEGKSTTKDKSLICPVDNLLSGPLGFTAKKEERRSSRVSPRTKEQLPFSDATKVAPVPFLGEHRTSDTTGPAAVCAEISNHANEALVPNSIESSCPRHSASGTGSKTPSTRSKSRVNSIRPRRAVRQKSITNMLGGGNGSKSHTTQMVSSGTKVSHSTGNRNGSRRARSLWSKHLQKPVGKTDTNPDGTRSPRLMERPRVLPGRNTSKPRNRCNRPRSVLSTSRGGAGFGDLDATPPQPSVRIHSPCKSIQVGFNFTANLTQTSVNSAGETPFGSHGSLAPTTLLPDAVCNLGNPSPSVLDVDDFEDGGDEGDDDEDGALRTQSRQLADYDDDDEEDEDDDDDDDDDDGDDDLDDYDDARDVISGTDEARDGASSTVSLTELVKSHVRFFPEWFDFPEEAPSSITQEQLMAEADSSANVWPFTGLGDSEVSFSRQINLLDDSTDQRPVTAFSHQNSGDEHGNTAQSPAPCPSNVLVYLNHARQTQGLLPFQLIAYPDLIGATGAPYIEAFNVTQKMGHSGQTARSSSPVDQNSVGSKSELSNKVDTKLIPPVDNAANKVTSGSNDLGDVTYLNVPTNDPRRHASHKTNKPDRHLTGSGQTVGARRRCATLRNGGSSSALETATRLPYSLVGLQHAEILDDVRRLIDPDDVLYRTIFDLDEVILSAVRDIQHHHHNRSVDSRPGSPRPISGRVAVGHTNSDCAVSNANLGATSVGPGQQQQQQPQLPQRQSQVNQINTASHTSQSATVSNRTLSTPEGHHSSVTASFVPDIPPVPHVSERCECDGHGDCMLTNEDETCIDQFDLEKGFLTFESRFECGNLRKAIQVRQFEYDLILNPDINTISNLQWFYFRVANVESGVEYRFNVINCEKPGSQFTSGMQPLLFSVREALEGRPYWIRAGTRVNYYRNHFVRPVVGKHTADGSTYHTATFQIRFPHTGDVCYLAYHYPYTYTRLMTDIVRWQDQANELHSVPVYFRVQSLTSTLLENPVPLLTITAKTGPTDNCSTSVAETDGRKTTSDSVTKNKSPNRPYIFLTARVHSGEANSSWVMQGLVNRLLSDHPVAVQARQQFIFKIVPMLNPDGVICGNHRCSMAGKDLNRRWSNPSSFNHPTIYHTKKLLHLLHACNRSPFVFIDFHGHSRMKNIFLYGCSPFESWKNPDTDNPTYRGSELGEDPSYRYLATILDDLAPAFAKRSCMYVVNKAKETTARVAVWREFGVIRSYTIEASYCGVTQYAGQPSNPPTSNQPAVLTCSNQGHQMNLAHLQTFGAQLLNAFVSLPAHIERAAASDLKANMPDTTDQIGQGPSLTDETPDASCAKHHGSSFRSRRGSFSLDSACSLPSTISPVSSVHSLYSHSSASLSAQLSQSNSGHSSGSLTDG